jgi:hypothetical protein
MNLSIQVSGIKNDIFFEAWIFFIQNLEHTGTPLTHSYLASLIFDDKSGHICHAAVNRTITIIRTDKRQLRHFLHSTAKELTFKHNFTIESEQVKHLSKLPC